MALLSHQYRADVQAAVDSGTNVVGGVQQARMTYYLEAAKRYGGSALLRHSLRVQRALRRVAGDIISPPVEVEEPHA